MCEKPETTPKSCVLQCTLRSRVLAYHRVRANVRSAPVSTIVSAGFCAAVGLAALLVSGSLIAATAIGGTTFAGLYLAALAVKDH